MRGRNRMLGLMWLGAATVAMVLGGCTSASTRATSSCHDPTGDASKAQAWADMRSATVTADDDAIEAVIEFAEPLPDDVHGVVSLTVGILDPPPEDRSVLGGASGTAFIKAQVENGTWTFGVLDGRRDTYAVAAIGHGEVDGRTLRLSMPTSRIGRTGKGSGWQLEAQSFGMPREEGDRCPDNPLGVDF